MITKIAVWIESDNEFTEEQIVSKFTEEGVTVKKTKISGLKYSKYS